MRLSESFQMFELAKIGEVSPVTISWYEQRLRTLVSFLDDMHIEDITVNDLRRWRARLFARDSRWADHPGRPEEEGGLSPWTLHGYIRAVRHFFNFLVLEGCLEHSPAKRLKLPDLPKEPPKYIDRDDAMKILKAARGNKRDYAIVRVLLDTACRLGGAASLRLDKIDLKGRITPDGKVVHTAEAREKGRGGTLRVRTLYFGRGTARAIRAYLEVRPLDQSVKLFLGQQGPLTGAGIYQVLKRLAKKAGVTGRWNPHAFRHGWAHEALKKGADLSTVCEVLGHSDIKVTHQFYARWADIELAERHTRFSWGNSVADD